ncbi:RNA-directed DNA polymerase [Staphylococcus caprae]|uniref:RNA-directed DNA polymerase n=1 Tax=Staphylococcus caprae TaxID=29380 RepID=UPI003B226F5F
MKKMKKLYYDMFNIEFLIKYGYFDVTPKKKQNEFNILVNDYGKSDSFYMRIFNFEQLSSYLVKNYVFLKNQFFKDSNISTEPINFTIPKTKYSRRQYKLPNIYSYIHLAIYMIENKQEFINVFVNNNYSLSKFFNLFDFNFEFTQEINKTLLQGGHNILHMDLSNFYHSLYTHSIPWVIMGKKQAKASQRKGFANKLDRLITRCQNNETHGVPTGNMLSRIIAELYMCYIDKELENSGYVYSRYVDDISYSFTIEEDKEKFIRDFNNICIKYELKINDLKTNINSFPYENLNNKDNIFNYFDNLSSKSKAKTWRKEIRKFIDLCVSEENRGNKGSIKSIFPVIANNLKNKKIKRGKIKKIFGYTNTISGFNLLEYLIDVSLKDSRLTNRFLTFVNEIKALVKEESFINLIFQNYFSKNKKLIKNNINYYNINNYHQELYQILIYMLEFHVDNILLKKNAIKLINENTDDFCLILTTIYYLNKKWKLKNLLNTINDLFKTTISFYHNNTNRMTKKLWFYRYFIYYLQNNEPDFRKAINKYCSENNFKRSKHGFMCELNWRYIMNLSKSDDITLFFDELIKNKIELVNFKYIEKIIKY